MKPNQRTKWEQTRTKGLWRYFLPFWVLLLGGTMIITTSIFDHFTSGFRVEYLKIKVPIFLASAFISGLAYWFYAEYKFRGSSRDASQ
jgi:hypothetical protein